MCSALVRGLGFLSPTHVPSLLFVLFYTCVEFILRSGRLKLVIYKASVVFNINALNNVVSLDNNILKYT